MFCIGNSNVVIGKIVKLNSIVHVLHIGNDRYGLYAGWYSIIEKLNIHDAMDQAIRDCEAAGKGDIPIVAHKKKYTKFLVTMRAEDFFKLYRKYNK